jgi:hypothetical protein
VNIVQADIAVMTEHGVSSMLSAAVARRVRRRRRTSPAVIAANRQNAQRSTGPRTPAGKARAARNALRHGLTRPVLADPALAREVEARAHRIAGEGASPERRALAVAVAEAEIDLARIARVRADLAAQIAAGCDVEKQLPAIDRYERRAQCRHEFALEDLAAATTAAEAAAAAQSKARQDEADPQGGREQSEPERNEPEWQGGHEQDEPKRNEAKLGGPPVPFQKVIMR